MTAETPEGKEPRERWVHEDNIINYRLTWLLYGQTVLFAAYSVALGIPDKSQHCAKVAALIKWLPWLGVVVALVTMAGIIASLVVHCKLISMYGVEAVRVDSRLHWLGYFPVTLPLIFLIAWIIVLGA